MASSVGLGFDVPGAAGGAGRDREAREVEPDHQLLADDPGKATCEVCGSRAAPAQWTMARRDPPQPGLEAIAQTRGAPLRAPLALGRPVAGGAEADTAGTFSVEARRRRSWLPPTSSGSNGAPPRTQSAAAPERTVELVRRRASGSRLQAPGPGPRSCRPPARRRRAPARHARGRRAPPRRPAGASRARCWPASGPRAGSPAERRSDHASTRHDAVVRPARHHVIEAPQRRRPGSCRAEDRGVLERREHQMRPRRLPRARRAGCPRGRRCWPPSPRR